MHLKCKALCALLFLTALMGSVSSEAAVSVRGKNLDDIDDIIGTAVGGNATLKKHSFGIISFLENFTVPTGSDMQYLTHLNQTQDTKFTSGRLHVYVFMF